eukprot:maker-scaffold332_size203095-snap-gene-1.19 protein:Tk10837 transcript:maker-scaffold332_size203095-snap-gene-1.19-mRNA-1 annotation:"hypothetical protein DAPPUDRAFT_327763"
MGESTKARVELDAQQLKLFVRVHRDPIHHDLEVLEVCAPDFTPKHELCLGGIFTEAPHLLYAANTLVDNGIAMWNKFSALREAIVGGGATSAVTSSLLKDQGCTDVTVWDKARGLGGRMSTSRSPGNPECTADLGAQYISVTTTYAQEHKSFHEELVSAGLLKPLTADIAGHRSKDSGMTNYVTPKGVSSLVKHYFTKSQFPVGLQHHVSDVSLNGDASRWTVRTQTGHEDDFDVVVLTMPVPQVLQLAGSIQGILKENHNGLTQDLQGVKYSARYAMAYFYDQPTDLGWDFEAKYVENDPVIRFVAVDNAKRGHGSGPTSILFHTSVKYGQEHVEKTPQAMEAELDARIRKLFPDLPRPKHLKCQKWRYSQVTRPFPELPGSVCLADQPLLLVGGDAFTHSNFDGCIKSARSIVQRIVQSA